MVADAMKQISAITGREYKPFTYYGDPDAENVIVAMGSVNETIKETIDYMRSKGEKAGRRHRSPLPSVLAEVPVRRAARFGQENLRARPHERTRSATASRCIWMSRRYSTAATDAPLIVGGRYGLSSKDTDPGPDAGRVRQPEGQRAEGPLHGGHRRRRDFHLSARRTRSWHLDNADTFEARFIGLGADGTVGANKNSIKIIGDTTDKYCQAYFAYDSKKSGGYTASHLRFGDKPITLALSGQRRPTSWPATFRRIWASTTCSRDSRTEARSCSTACGTPRRPRSICPTAMKKYLAEHHINFYIINATKIAAEIGLGSRTNTIMQSAFFKVDRRDSVRDGQAKR